MVGPVDEVPNWCLECVSVEEEVDELQVLEACQLVPMTLVWMESEGEEQWRLVWEW